MSNNDEAIETCFEVYNPLTNKLGSKLRIRNPIENKIKKTNNIKLVNPKTGAYKGLGSFVSIAKIFPTSWDWQAFWTITAFLSIMLGVLNLLPIPALDGGNAMFLTY